MSAWNRVRTIDVYKRQESCRDFLTGKVVSRVFRFPILSVFTEVEILLSVDFHNTREPVGETIDEDYDIVSQCSDFCPGAAVGRRCV